MSEDKLRVIAVGGAGSMGRWAVRTLAQLGTASVITVADIDADRAQRTAEAVGDVCRSLVLDATDPHAMRAAFFEHDVVINTMGPFANFAGPILDAAIDSGCHYLDINDDWQPTLASFELDARARTQGLHAVIGLGGSPGVTNLCAVLAAETLDRVDELYTGWKVSAATIVEEPGFPVPDSTAAMDHWIHQCSGPIRVWDDGKPAEIEPVEPIELEFPDRGTVVVYTMGHPEPITLPRKYPGLRRAVNLQSGPTWMLDKLREVGGEYSRGEVTLQEGSEKIANHPRPAQKGPRDPLPIEWALAIGTKDGREQSTAAYPLHFHPARMGGNTGVPLAIGVELLRRGRLLDTGVHAPETAIPAKEFFDLLAPLNDESLKGAEDLIEIVSSTRARQ